MKVSFVVARVEVGCVQRRYSVQRETLIRVGICEVRCMRKTELHLTLPAREQPSKLLLAREVPTRGCARQGRSRPTHIYLSPVSICRIGMSRFVIRRRPHYTPQVAA